MYSKQQAAHLKQQFWTSFGKYMLPIFSAEGLPVNWVNYKTGEKDIFFKMQADNKHATIGIYLAHRDADLQSLYFEQLQQLKNILHSTLEEEWNWQLHIRDENAKIISAVSKSLDNVSIYKQEDWPQLISFFKPRIIALDLFWSNTRHIFEELR